MLKVNYRYYFLGILIILMMMIIGECYGVVIAIGSNTVLGKMIDKGQWPPTIIS